MKKGILLLLVGLILCVSYAVYADSAQIDLSAIDYTSKTGNSNKNVRPGQPEQKSAALF